ncbi:hypothetical protein HUO13_22250 [Saccharopolyspora erythraea]|uniref:spermidine synthase n=1 Tax=Saccharopolyspora erythraea TaxID=1836 RepID=UPI001BAB05DC|nr:hypothetical protein [Saccharopolyspora erythraea]QUH03182.1 hypothetical protein HUO13_22250 [Saccharopolyspora erythraea]
MEMFQAPGATADVNGAAHSRVATATSERGEVVLLRRGDDGALELRVNGVFVMDTVHTATERLLATTTLTASLAGRTPGAPVRVLIGGLGLGFTLQEVLADRRVTAAHVVEIEPAVVRWHQEGLVPDTARAFGDKRVEVSVGDVREVLARLDPSSVDVLLLDVDNGPGFLVYDDNAAVYRREFLELCREKLVAGGCLAIWSASPSAELASMLGAVFTDSQEVAIPVVFGERATTYHLFIARQHT